ncbi:MAG: acylneuraminate cytidylyltransferase [Anaerolineaceae bacterium]|nr:acylneuraminate cytidylyltransferase [Anaerolineaceae bacterium]
MVEHPEVLAIIPARGGSKGIPRKNIKLFAGAPLLAWSIQAAKESKLVTRCIVSTDDEEIAEIAQNWGAEVPFLRPAELAADSSPDLPLFTHALEWLNVHEHYEPDLLVQLRPTSPVRPAGLVDDAITLIIENPQADCVRGIVPSGQNPYKMWQIDEASGQMQPLLSMPDLAEPYNAARQALPKTYWQTGHIDVIRTRSVLEKHSLTGSFILPVMIDPCYTVDIDQPSDWEKYEALVRDEKLIIVDPLKGRRHFPEYVSMLIMDFDGVFTDDKVYLDEEGHEFACCDRGDGMGMSLLKTQTDISVLVMSRDTSKISHARAKKLKIEAFSSVMDKGKAIESLVTERGLKPEELIFMGNDLPDLDTYPYVGFFVCPADAQPEVRRRADLVLQHRGGNGAIRELTDILIEKFNKKG